MPATTETVQIEGLPVRLHAVAPAERLRTDLAPTVVFVHGIGMSHRSFTRSQRAVAATHRTVSVDLPGFGGLPAAGRSLSMAELGDLVVRAVRSLGADDVVLVGQSMGAQVAVEAARQCPGTIGSVVLVGPVVPVERRPVPLVATDLLRDSAGEGLRMNAVLVTDYLRSVRQYAAQLGPMLRYRMEETITDVGQPVLVVRGTGDPIARRAWCQQIAAAAPNGSFVELPGAHQAQEHQPVAFARLVGAFRHPAAVEDRL